MQQIKTLGIRSSKKGDSKQLQIFSQIWQRQLGQYCQYCQIKLKDQDCISLCKCSSLFCHQQCFVKNISQYLTLHSSIKCARCDQYINMTMNTTVLWVCNKKPAYIIGVIGAILMMIGLYLIIADGVYTPYLPDAASYTILSFIALFLIYAILKSSRVKLVKLQDIRVISTKKEFKNSDTEKYIINQEMADTDQSKNKLGSVSKVELMIEETL